MARRAVTAVIAMGLAVTSCGSLDADGLASREITSVSSMDVEVDAIVASAGDFAEALTSRRPSGAVVYRADHQAALAALDLGERPVDDADPVVLVTEIRGELTAHGGPRPMGAEAPTGRQLVLIVDGSDGEMLEFALRGEPADLGAAFGDGTAMAVQRIP